jgi:crotonobetainyl-CoA:carnitine CoA-transferase CaiB-like acyl-CoA transferase
MQSPTLADDSRYATNASRVANRIGLEAMIEARFRSFARADVITLLEEADIATGAVNDVPAVAAHPQLAARGRWAQVESPGGDIPALLPPHNLQSAPSRMGRVPSLGQHTGDVLAAMELS